MNESGGRVSTLANFYKVPADRLVVVHDELDIPFGALRVKLGGGDNGHNGLRSMRVARHRRLLPGPGRHRAPPGRLDAADFVLSDYSSTERKELPVLVVEAADAVESLVADGLERPSNASTAEGPH